MASTDFNFEPEFSPRMEAAMSRLKSQIGGGKGKPPVASEDEFSAGMDGMFDQINQETFGSISSKPGVEYHGANAVDTFSSQKHFQGAGFNPTSYQDNYARYAKMNDWGETFSKSFDDFGYKFKNSFGEYWASYGRMGQAIWNMDWAKMDLAEEDKILQYYKDNLNEQENHIFMNESDQESFFNKQFAKDFIGNAGFALGTFAGASIEIAADMLITAATGGAAAPAAGASLIARVGGKLGQVAKGMTLADRTADQVRAAGKVIESAEAARKMSNMRRVSETARRSMSEMTRAMGLNFSDVARSKSLYEAVSNTLKHLPVVGTAVRYGERIDAAVKTGQSAATIAGMTLQGFRRSLVELNMASAEAAFESVTSYGDTLDKMIQNYEQLHGVMPSGNTIMEMRQRAMDGSFGNYNTNLALLLASNKLQFGNMFSRFMPANRLLREMTEETLDDVLKVSQKGAATQFYRKGLFGTYGLAGKIATDFGSKKTALKEVTKALGRDFLQMEVSEGIQENLQETSAHAWKEHYASMYSRNPESLLHAMQQGLGEQFSEQGLKTFLMGAFTGSIIRIPTVATQKAMAAGNEAMHQYKANRDAPVGEDGQKTTGYNPVREEKRRLDEDLAELNEFMKMDGNEIFSDKIFNFKAQMAASMQMSQAAAQGQIYEFKNAWESSILSAVKTARRTNTSSAIIDQLERVGQSFTPEEFKEAFGFDIKEAGYDSVEQMATKVARDMESYVETIDKVKRQVGPLVDPYIHKQGSRDRYASSIIRGAYEDAVESVAMNAIKGNMAAERLQKLRREVESIPGMAASSDLAVRTLGSYMAMQGDLGNVTHEAVMLRKQIVEVTDRRTLKQLNEQLKLKEQEQELLEEWMEYFQEEYVDVEVDDAEKPGSKKTTRQYTGSNFTGVREYRPDDQGNMVQHAVYNHKDVQRTFAKLVSLKNKQAGIPEEITLQSLNEAFDKVTDYYRLDKDLKEYQQAADMLHDPDAFMEMLIAMTDGRFKHMVQEYLVHVVLRAQNNLRREGIHDEATLDEFGQFIQDHEAYQNLQVILLDPQMGVHQMQAYDKLQKELTAAILDKVASLTGKPTKPATPAPTTTPPAGSTTTTTTTTTTPTSPTTPPPTTPSPTPPAGPAPTGGAPAAPEVALTEEGEIAQMANNVPPPLDRAQAARDMADGKLTEQELRDMGYRNTVINIVKAEAEKIKQRASEPEQADDGPVATSDVDQFDSLLGEDGPDKPAPTGPEVFAGQDVDDMGVYDHLLGEDEDSQDNNNQDNNNQDNSNQDNGSQQDDYQVTPTPPGPVEPDGPLSPGDSLTFDVTTPSGAVMSSGHKTGEEADEKIDQINMMRSALQAANRSLDEVKPGATSDPSLAPSLAEALIEKAGRVKGTLTNDRFLDYALSANGKRELATLTYALLGMKKPARPRKKKPTAQTALNFDAPADNSFVPKEEEEQAQVLKPELPKNAIESLLDEIDELWEEDQVVEVGANNPAEVLQNPAENRNFEEQGPAVDAHGVPVFQSEAEAMDLFAKLAACHKKN